MRGARPGEQDASRAPSLMTWMAVHMTAYTLAAGQTNGNPKDPTLCECAAKAYQNLRYENYFSTLGSVAMIFKLGVNHECKELCLPAGRYAVPRNAGNHASLRAARGEPCMNKP